jgi:hypothetical protein
LHADYSQAPDIYYSSMDARLVVSGIRDEVRQVADGYLLGECWRLQFRWLRAVNAVDKALREGMQLAVAGDYIAVLSSSQVTCMND